MLTRSGTDLGLSSALEKIVERVVEVARPDRVILFGSRAKNAASPESDYDLLVVKAGEYSRRKLAIRLHQGLVNVPGPVDVLVVTPELLEKYKDVPALIYANILKEGIEIYAA